MLTEFFLLCTFFLLAGVFIPAVKYKQLYSLVVFLILGILASVLAVNVFWGGDISFRPYSFCWNDNQSIVIDKLSAFFILVLTFTSFTGLLFSGEYLQPYKTSKSSLSFSLHYISYLLLYISMIMVTVFRDTMSFLIAWELMTLSSFLLVIFDAENPKTLKTGINYLVQMHFGMLCLIIGFFIAGRTTGSDGFDSLKNFFAFHSNIPLFILFFIGFGIKAGFIPLHTWLPNAHPAAPSHVSGVMSGVMIKMGVYGIIRVLTYVQTDLMGIGIFILIISIVSALLGVMNAIIQHDLKKLLAYHSIENIGIIGVGLGLGTIGLATANQWLIFLGFAGGLLHILNHSLFKSLLFYSAGAVYRYTHTRNIEELGGLVKKMPYTAAFFLIGSLAICGLPPFNGFISEYLIYLGIFKGLHSAGISLSVLLLIVLALFALVGGLAVFCFTKAFGITFLGNPRSEKVYHAKEPTFVMLFPMLLCSIFILTIGLFPILFLRPISQIITNCFAFESMAYPWVPFYNSLNYITYGGSFFLLLTALLLFVRYRVLKSRSQAIGPTWGCGYTAGSSKQQYTATSFAYNYQHIAKPVLHVQKDMEEIKNDEIFPLSRKFESHNFDYIEEKIINSPVRFIKSIAEKLAILQTGNINHYILYAFLFILFILLLTFLNLI
jgi:hydrogenase-4 component B